IAYCSVPTPFRRGSPGAVALLNDAATRLARSVGKDTLHAILEAPDGLVSAVSVPVTMQSCAALPRSCSTGPASSSDQSTQQRKPPASCMSDPSRAAHESRANSSAEP
ncbi:MAG: hypothetical protein ACR2FL_10965, partial [Nocardioidaceae bacterium]